MIDDSKRRWRAYIEEAERRQAKWRKRGYPSPPPPSVPFPDDLRGLACGATTRRGQPCKRTDLYLNGRCKFHGGLSTGPKSKAGKARSRANLALRWARDRKPMEG